MTTPSAQDLKAALDRCAAEPIHFAGAVQSNGALVAVESETVVFASRNVGKLLGVEVGNLLGRELHDFIGKEACQAIKDAAAREDAMPGTPVTFNLPGPRGRSLAAEVHMCGELRVVEFEPAVRGGRIEALLNSARDVLWSQVIPEQWQGYLERVARQMREVTGFDRVMIYQFDHNWDGEVVAENRNGRLGTLLGQRFPAADIPPQARALYERNLVRSLADVDAAPVPVVPARHPKTGAPLDMSLSLLRAMSPVHLQYLRNMGVRATLTVSLLSGGKLWGLIACHHATPRWVPFSVRGLAGLIGKSFSLHLNDMEAMSRQRRMKWVRETVLELSAMIENSEQAVDAIQVMESQILALVSAHGCVMVTEGKWLRFGATPEWSAVKDLQGWLRQHQPGSNTPFTSDELSAILPDSKASARDTAGLLAVPLNENWESFIFWFRHEVEQDVKWAGPPAAKNLTFDGHGPRLAPRASFALWREKVKGRSLRWAETDVDAAHTFSNTLAQLVFRRALKASEDTYRLLADNASDMVSRHDPEGRFIFASPASRDMFRTSDGGGLIGRRFSDLVSEQDRRSMDDAFSALSSPGSESRHALTYRPLHRETKPTPWYETVLRRDEQGWVLATTRDVTERLSLENAANKLRLHNDAILAGAEDGIIGIGVDGAVRFANPSAERLLGAEPGSLVGEPIDAVVQCRPAPDANCRPGSCNFLNALRRGRPAQATCSYFLRRGAQEAFAVETIVSPVALNDAQSVPVDEAVQSVLVFRDVTERQSMQRQLRQSHAAIESASEAIVTIDRQGKVRGVNAAFQEMTGYREAELLGKPIGELRATGGDNAVTLRRLLRDLIGQGRWRGELWLKSSIGDRLPTWGSVTAVTDGQSRAIQFVATLTDMSALRESADRLRFASTHDTFTGLPNRIYLEQALGDICATASSAGKRLVVAFFDIDQLQLVNDSHGHAMGDLVLMEMAARLRAGVPAEQLVARWGGDEFVAILQEVADMEQAAALLDRLSDGLRRQLQVREFVFIPSITIGAAVFPDDGEQTGALISRAHAALHRAKSAGRGRFEFFNEALTENSRRRLELNWELRKAVEENQLVLFYQPQISAADGALVGLEALVRWRHPRMGLLGPGAFLDHAEELGLLPLIGRWVRAAACRQLQTWGDTLPPGVRVAINVMPEELTTGLVEELRDLLDRTAVPAERLEIEVVEGAMSRGDEVPQILESVRRMGVGVAIDDFGTGFSSLARLRDLPFDCLKIDKQFIDGVATESRDRAIVDSIGSLGRNLRVRVLAEGVEDEQQVQELCLLEVDVFQGFHFSRPLPVDELEALFLVESEKLLKDALSS